ncbi:MAG: hypothetical protein LGL72_02660 [Acidibrevibacterium sp.]|jgi:hypothetical protein|uniref:hypothetical protein n=1 Tax=Acidibrevibacterium fodinaquatile TaxID=1969806 RepID=UPI0023A84E9D|nr:hypothetical protein [Acidibrevibacterium fodinaquatile]MCA7118316.1 hypothetical protein [Acidibrevibacterium fodinaquatile]
MVVVEGAIHASNSVAELATMLAIGIVLGMFGIGSLCWLMFTLAVYALPFFAGMSAGLAAYHSGAGVIGALVVGVAAGAVTLIAGQFIFATVTSPLLRGLIALLFAAPATVAGYHATLALARLGVPAEGWREVFAVIGAIAVGATAIVRIAAMATPSGVRDISVSVPARR